MQEYLQCRMAMPYPTRFVMLVLLGFTASALAWAEGEGFSVEYSIPRLAVTNDSEVRLSSRPPGAGFFIRCAPSPYGAYVPPDRRTEREEPPFVRITLQGGWTDTLPADVVRTATEADDGARLNVTMSFEGPARTIVVGWEVRARPSADGVFVQVERQAGSALLAELTRASHVTLRIPQEGDVAPFTFDLSGLAGAVERSLDCYAPTPAQPHQ